MSVTTTTLIDRVSIEELPGELKMTSRMGYGTVMPLTLTMVIVCLGYFLAVLFSVPDRLVAPIGVTPAVIAGAFLLAAGTLNRTHVQVTGGGLTWGTGPIPVPEFPLRRTLRTDQIAAIFVSPCAVSNRYSRTYIHTYDVFVLSTAGQALCLFARIDSLDAARQLATRIENGLGVAPIRPAPPLSIEKRPVRDSQNITPAGLPVMILPLAAMIAGVVIFVSPSFRVQGMKEVLARVTEVGHRRVNGPKSSYDASVCHIVYDTPGGLVNNQFGDGCPQYAKIGDRMTIYYDVADPEKILVLASGFTIFFGSAYLLGGLGMLIYLISVRRKKNTAVMRGGPRILDEDKFRALDPYWDLTESQARATQGILELTAQPGKALMPLLCHYAYRTPVIDLRVSAKMGNNTLQGAGIFFWANGVGDGYVFKVVPAEGGIDAWRLTNHKWERVLPFTRIQQIAPINGQWNDLRVVTHDDGRADLYVNAIFVATIQGEPPPGGSLAGLYADFLKDTNAVWEFAGFRVTAPESQ